MDFDLFDQEPQTNTASNNAQHRPSTSVTATAAKKLKIANENRPTVTSVQMQQVDHSYKPSEQILTNPSTVPADLSANLEPSLDNPQSLVLTHQVRHQVAIPKNYPFVPLSHSTPSATPARVYPFTLDPFQQLAIQCIERQESVLVSAHTSAGKTVVAEYAIAVALRDKQRVIYTSPIKALSNQKYRELSQEFGDVGLMTGDVTINPSASCLVMTTEILRSMLYRGSEVMREVSFVIFDEIHYMRDKNRGVVWEECIIMLDDKVKYVFLSATIPNAMQFAEWICGMHGGPCHVVYTDYRPTPLQHYLFPQGGDGIYLAVDEKGQFREDNFQKAIANLQDDKSGAKKASSGKKGGKPDKSTAGPTDLFKIVKMIMQKNYHPVIVFSFSKKECESNALQLSKLSFNDASEKDLVTSVFQNAISSLSEIDRTLPQIEHILPLLQRGIGIHHSGLLPILKEVIEILFQEGLLKVLFATETFSIGLNMPARTVVFTNVKKWDGKETRWLGGGEYIQMSGRAGRRGLDDRGIVILMVDSKMEPAVAKNMLKGEADRLDSAFYLGYSMILNLIRVEGVAPEFMLERCFLQFQNCDRVPKLEEEIQILERRRDEFIIEDEELVQQYYNANQQKEQLIADVRDVVNHPTYCLPYLQPGRLVRITIRSEKTGTSEQTNVSYGWGCVLNFQKRISKSKDLSNASEVPVYIVDVLLECAKGTESHTKNPLPPSGESEMCVVVVDLKSLDAFSTVRIHVPKDIKSADARQQVSKVLKEVAKRCGGEIPLLDPISDMGIKDTSFVQLYKKIGILESTMKNSPFFNHPKREELFEEFGLKQKLNEKIKALHTEVQAAHSIIQLDELKCRRRVLRRLGYIDQSDVIGMKGRVACEISAGDELLLTEMIFQGSFNDLTVEQTVTLLSCFTWQEKSEGGKIKEELAGPFKQLQELARRIAKISEESKLDLNEEDYVNSFRPEIMDVVYAWCNGSTFSEVMQLTDAFEGSVIRCMRNLEELLRQMCAASKAIGNDMLEEKFAAGINKIKRDIVFAASLYL